MSNAVRMYWIKRPSARPARFQLFEHYENGFVGREDRAQCLQQRLFVQFASQFANHRLCEFTASDQTCFQPIL